MIAAAASMLARSPGVIHSQEAYTLAEFRQRTGLARYALGQAERSGLKVIKVGKKRFVRGVDWQEFLNAQAGGS